MRVIAAEGFGGSYQSLTRHLRSVRVMGPQKVAHLMCPPDIGPVLQESGGAGVVGVELLIGDRGEHPEGAMTTGPVVEHLDPIEDLRRQFRAGPPLAAVEQLGLHAGPERLDHGVVEGVADGAQGVRQVAARTRWLNVQAVNCEPWSLWISVPARGWRPSTAMPSAELTIAAVGRRSSDQPTTRRDQASSTTQQ